MRQTKNCSGKIHICPTSRKNSP